MMKCIAGQLCGYFKKCVLPLDPVLEAKLSAQTVEMKECAECGRLFPVYGRQIYCSEKCKQIGARKMERAKKKKQRAK